MMLNEGGKWTDVREALQQLPKEKLDETSSRVWRRVRLWLWLGSALFVLAVWRDWRFILMEVFPLAFLGFHSLILNVVREEQDRRRG